MLSYTHMHILVPSDLGKLVLTDERTDRNTDAERENNNDEVEDTLHNILKHKNLVHCRQQS